MLPRTNHHDFNVQLQVQEGKGFPQILYGIDQDRNQRSISLKPGYEYVIELRPYGKVSTDEVKEMPMGKRKCRLIHETLDGSTHPLYIKDNCLYDCHVQKASEVCQCVPWDFANMVKNGKEYDIFGRTCFFNMIENLTHVTDETCLHCEEECDWIRYRRKVIRSESISLELKSGGHLLFDDIFLDGTQEYCNKYICVKSYAK